MKRTPYRYVKLWRFIAVTVIVLLADGVPANLAHGDRGDDGQQVVLGGNIPRPAKPAYSKLDSQLNQKVKHLPSQLPSALFGTNNGGNRVPVTIRTPGGVSGVLAFIAGVGGRLAYTGAGYVEAELPVTALPGLNARTDVLKVTSIIGPQPLAVVSEGTVVHRSNVWNSGGFTGSGVRVGIIDAGFEGYASLIGTELPSPAAVRCYTAIGVFSTNLADCENGEVHGTAVTEAVVDIAPGVMVYLARPMSQGDLKSIVTWMLSQGVDVINQSLGWVWEGPGDGTTIYSDGVLNTVDTAVTGGIVWVNAAGNAAQDT
ncbi:MAG: hypothetical protein FJ317_00140 [SAR202 cluster bacterium]|nr:hypothetical protein [SAR202 cluster bacterium]